LFGAAYLAARVVGLWFLLRRLRAQDAAATWQPRSFLDGGLCLVFFKIVANDRQPTPQTVSETF
jgi:hypothetical protein